MKRNILLVSTIVAMGFVIGKSQYWYDTNKSDSIRSIQPASEEGREDIFLNDGGENAANIVQINEISHFSLVINPAEKNKFSVLTKHILSLKGGELDKNVIRFIKDKKMSRRDKLTLILSLIDEAGMDSVIGSYFFDVLDYFNPIEISGILINKFQSPGASGQAKKSILRVLANSYGLDPSKAPDDIAKLIAQNSIAIQDFFTDQIKNPTDKDIFKQAIELYPSVSSGDEIDILNDALRDHNDLIPIQDGLNIRLDSALTTQRGLVRLLSGVQKSRLTAETKNEFNERLFVLLQSEGAESIVGNDEKPGVAKYIESQRPILDMKNSDFNSRCNYNNWLQSYAAMSSEINERQSFMTNYVEQSTTAIQKAAIILLANDGLLSDLQRNGQIKNDIQKEIDGQKLNNDATQIMKNAVSRLDGVGD